MKWLNEFYIPNPVILTMLLPMHLAKKGIRAKRQPVKLKYVNLKVVCNFSLSFWQLAYRFF